MNFSFYLLISHTFFSFVADKSHNLNDYTLVKHTNKDRWEFSKKT